MKERKDGVIELTRMEWLSMKFHKIKVDRNTAKKLAEVFGNKVYNDIEIILNNNNQCEKDEQTQSKI